MKVGFEDDIPRFY